VSRGSQEIRVTVAITSYNYKQYICEAVNSALIQDFQHLEVLVFDDASSDGSPAFLADSYKDRITLKTNLTNNGQGNALNWCIHNAKGEFILFLDGDDILMPDAVSSLYDNAQSADVIFGFVDSFVDKTNERADRHESINSEVKELQRQNSTKRLAQMMSRSNKLMRVDFLRKNDVRSSTNCIMNDALFAYTLAASAPSCNFTSKVIMSIRQHPLSMSKPNSIEKLEGVLAVTSELNQEIWKRTPFYYLTLSGNNLAYFILGRGQSALPQLCKLKRQLSFISRMIVVLKCLKNDFNLKYTKLL